MQVEGKEVPWGDLKIGEGKVKTEEAVKGEGTEEEGVSGDEEEGGGKHGCQNMKNLLGYNFLQLLNISSW